MLASFCTIFWDVQSFIFCIRAVGGRLTSRGRFAPTYLNLETIDKMVALCEVLTQEDIRRNNTFAPTSSHVVLYIRLT